MSYFLLYDSKVSLAGSASPLIRKLDREAFVDADAFLRRARTIAEDADMSVEMARQQAVQQGYAAGVLAAETEHEEAMRGFTEAVTRIEEFHGQQVATAAYAATVAIIGELDDDELVTKLLARVLAKQKEQLGVAIHVAPDLQPKVAGQFGDPGALPVVANADLGPAECHIMTADGRIIASLPVQLAVLRDRWGLSEAKTDR